MGASDMLRVGVIGVGNMGSGHARRLLDGKVSPRATLGAVADVDPKRLDGYGDVPTFDTGSALIHSGTCDAVLVATPHFDHTTLGSEALRAGLHTLVEKPISVHKADCERLIAAYRERPHERQVFAAMFNQRTDPKYRKVKALIDGGELGEIRRVSWIITNWFRTEAYYASGGWRATWAGEGGGVLLNQCPHQLDLLQWLCGMPKQVDAHCALGKYHDIEVEDEVTAYLEWPNGATGVFITTTAEAPGTNRLEIVGERGRLTVEDDQLLFLRNEVKMTEWSRTTTGGFSKPAMWRCEIPVHGHGGQHLEIKQNFVSAILDDQPLIAPATEGIHSVELGNAMLMSGLQRKPVSIPLPADEYESLLKGLIDQAAQSGKTKTVTETKPNDFANSF